LAIAASPLAIVKSPDSARSIGSRPAAVTAALPKVRGTKNPDLAALRALAPDLVVANAEENRRIDVERLEAAGVAVYVTAPVTVAGAVDELRQLAAAVGGLPGAAAIDAGLRAAVARAARERPAVGTRYACAVWRDPWMWLGARTYAADLLRLAGGEAVVTAPRYPRLDPAEVAALGPEVVLLPSEPYPFGPADADAVASWSGRRALLVDGRALTWYGPRIPAALGSLARLLRASRT